MLISSSAGAATVTWTGGGTTPNWSDAGNWGGTLPFPGDDLVFAGTTTLAPFNDYAAGTSYRSITFAAGAGAFMVGGNAVTLTGGAVAIRNFATSGTVTLDLPLTCTVASTITGSFGGTLVLNRPIANGNALLTVAAGGTVTIAGGVTGSGGLTKTGGGTLTLSGLAGVAGNNYAGTTTITQGTLAISGMAALTGGCTFGGSAGTTVPAGLAVTGNVTFTGMVLAQTNTATANTITISGGTLTCAGGLTLGVNSNASTVTKVNVSGTGALAVTGGNVQVGVSQSTFNAANQSIGTLDLSGLTGAAGFSATVTAFNVGQGNTSGGYVTLTNTANTIIADVVNIGHSNGNNGAGNTNTVVLGSGTNAILADTINIGISKVAGTLTFASQTPGSPGTLDIANRANNGGAVIVAGDNNGTSTAGVFTGLIDLRGHQASMVVSALTLGRCTNDNTGNTTGTFHFDGGNLVLGALTMGVKTGTGAGTGAGNLIISGGSCALNGPIATASRTGSAGAATSTITIAGGSVVLGADVLKSGGTNTTSTVVLDGGVLDAAGRSIGSATQTVVLTLNNGMLGHLAELNGGGTLTKSATGTVTLYTGTNTWSGTTSISAGGTLRMGTTGVLPFGVGKGNLVVDGTLDLYGHYIPVNGLTGAGVIANSQPLDATLSVGNNNATATFAGVIQTDVGIINLQKLGAGTLTLTGSHTYTGTTLVNSGALRVDGSLAGASAVTVAAGRLEGTGTIGGTVGVAMGELQPGAGGTSVGTLTLGDWTSSTAGIYSVDLNGSTADVVNLPGAVTLSGNLFIGSVTGTPVGAVTIVNAGGLISGTFTDVPDNATVAGGGRVFRVNYNANTVTLTEVGFVWDGGGGNNNWTTGDNWVGNVAPGPGADLVFAGAVQTTTNNDFPDGTVFNSISFAPGAGSFTLGSALARSVVLTGGLSAITSGATANTMTISLPVAFSTRAPRISTAAGGTLVMSGAMNNNGLLVTVVNAGPMTISGVLSGNGGLRKNAAGTLTMSALSTYSGGTLLTRGDLVMNNSGGAVSGPVGTGTVTIDSNGEAARILLNGTRTVSNALVMTSVAPGNGLGALHYAGTGLATWSGAITVNADNANGGHFLGGGSTANMLVLSGVLSSGGTTTTVNQRGGFVAYAGTPGTLVALTVTGTARLNASNVFPASVQIWLSSAAGTGNGGTLDLNNFNQTIGGLLLRNEGGGIINTGTGTLTLAGDITHTFTGTTDGTANVINGNLDLGGATRTVSVANGSLGEDVRIQALVSNGALTKTGAGRLQLGGAASNTYTGTTTVQAGELRLAKNAGINAIAGPLAITGGRVLFGANHQIADTVAVTMSGAASVFNGTAINTGQLNNQIETIDSLTVTGGCFNAGLAQWTITNTASFTGGNNTSFVGNNGTRVAVGGLVLTGMNGTAGANPGTANSFTVYGTNTTFLTTLTVGAGGVTLDGSFLHLRRGNGAGQLGSKLIINGDVTTVGTTPSAIREDTNGGTIGTIAVDLSGSAGAVTRAVTTPADLLIGVPVVDGAATPGGLTKSGAGVLTLSAANTWSGATTVSAGTLLVSGSTAGAGTITVDAGATLGGSGTVGTVVMSGGALAPGLGGTTIGTLTTGAVSWNPASTLTVDLLGTGPTGDRVASPGQNHQLAGNLAIAGLTSATPGQVFTIVTGATVDGLTSFAGLPAGSVIPVGGRSLRIAYLADSVTLTVVPPPDITSLSDANGLTTEENPISIFGNDFITGATVTIGGAPAVSVTFISANQLDIVTPQGTQGLRDVVVTNPDGQSDTLLGGYAYQGSAPTITQLQPAAGSPTATTPVMITGNGFLAPVSITVGGQAATNVVFISSTTISATFPAMSTAATDATPDVVVANGDAVTATLVDGFSYTVRPVDDADGALPTLLAYRYHQVGGPLIPDFSTLVPNQVATRSNANFAANPFEGRNDTWSVEFGGYLTVPTDGIYTLFTASDDGSRLFIGDTLVVSNNFAQGETERSGQIALAAGSHRLRVEYAQGGGDVRMNVRWQGPGLSKELIPGAAFSCDPAPIISGVSPVDGPQGGGTVLTISGSNFTPSSTVIIGGVIAVNPITLDPNTIQVSTSGGALGPQDVVVIGPRSDDARLAGGFTYLFSPPPSISQIDPANGPAIGGTTVTLTVAGVAATPTVTFNGVAATSVVRVDADTVTCVVPRMPASDTTADVVLTVGGQSTTVADGFTWNALRVAEDPLGTQAGLSFRYYRVGGPLVPTFASLTPAISDITTAGPGVTPGTNPFELRNDNWSVQYRGYLEVPNDGVYTLYTASDDGSRLYVGSTEVVANNFAQGVTERSGVIALEAGRHLVTIEFAQGTGGFGLYVRWAGPGEPYDIIPANRFFCDPTPVIGGLDVVNGPTSGGTVVSISGSGFTSAVGVTFGGTAALNVSVNGAGTLITCTTPSHAVGVVDVVVTNPTGTSATVVGAFTYDPSSGPSLIGITPPNGPADGGTLATITGADFGAPMTVTFGGVAATDVQVSGTGTITCTVPAMQGALLAVDVVVTNGAGQSATLPGAFTYDLRIPENPPLTQLGLTYRYHRVAGPNIPTFTGLTPHSIAVTNNPFIANNTNPFEPLRNDNWSVEFEGFITVPQDGVYSFFTQADDHSQVFIGSARIVNNTQVNVEVGGSIGLQAGTHRLTIRFAQGTGGRFLNVRWQGPSVTKAAIPDDVLSTLPTPTYGGISPALGSAAGGTAVNITGSGLAPDTLVSFDGVAATGVVAAVNGLSLDAVTPAHAAGWSALSLANRFGLATTVDNAFLYQGAPPTITAVSPQVGPVAGGTTVLIYGTNFSATPVVRFGGVLATNVSVMGGVISARTPPGAQGPVTLTVTTADNQTATRTPGFYYQGPAPTITTVAPARGPMTGGTVVTITGTNFTTGATVAFDGVDQPGVVVSGAGTVLTVTTIAGAQGYADVVVTNNDLRTATRVGGYVLEGPPPTLAGIAPPSGAMAGGTLVTVSGTNLAPGARVMFGTADASAVTWIDSSTLQAVTPAGPQGPVDVTVINVDDFSDTLTDAYIFLGAPPMVSGVDPTAVPNNLSTPITISGSGFVAGVQVTIGGQPATITGVTGGAITVTMPAGIAPGPAAIVVTNIDGQTTTFNGFIAQGPAPILTGIDVPHGPVEGGRLMTLTGSAFRTGAQVIIGGVAALNVQVLSATTITALTPAHGAGPVTVTVINDDLLSSSLVNAYTYYTENDNRTVGNGCGTGGGLAVFLLLGFLLMSGGIAGRRR